MQTAGTSFRQPRARVARMPIRAFFVDCRTVACNNNAAMKNLKTTSDAAKLFGKDVSHIRRVCISQDIGSKFGTNRMLTPGDILKLRRHFAKNGKRSKNCVESC